uniref:Uncharacterized protein n=1 Tax=Guillardia theta TaxID=55529 RepID=A0A7S4L252_GUITH
MDKTNEKSRVYTTDGPMPGSITNIAHSNGHVITTAIQQKASQSPQVWSENFTKGLLNLFDDFLPKSISSLSSRSPATVQKHTKTLNSQGEILILQFVAVSVPCEISRIYCTIEFYNFSECATENFQLYASEMVPNNFRSFFTKSIANLEIPKLTLQFITGNQFDTDNDSNLFQKDFLRYMEKGRLRIHIFDAESNLQIGTATAPLNKLIRHDRQMVQVVENCDIFNSTYISSVDKHTQYDVESDHNKAQCRLDIDEFVDDVLTWDYGEEDKKGQLCIRLIHAVCTADENEIVSKQDSPPKRTIFEIEDSIGFQRRTSDHEHDWKCLALIHGKIQEIQELVRRSKTQNGDQNLIFETRSTKMSKDELIKAVFDVGIQFTQRQANEICNALHQTFLQEHMQTANSIGISEDLIDISCIQAGFDSLILNSGCSQHEQRLLLDLNSKLLTFFASAYGNLDRAWEILSQNEEYRQDDLLETMKEANIHFDGPHYLLSENLTLMGKNSNEGVPKSRFFGWFGVAVYLENERRNDVADPETTSHRKKLLRWKRTQMIRRRLEAEGAGSLPLPQADAVIENAQYHHDKYREQKVSSYLQTSLISKLTLNCHSGPSKYFLHSFQNPYDNHRIFRVVIQDTDLDLVTDKEELEFLAHSNLIDLNQNLDGYLAEKVSIVNGQESPVNVHTYDVWMTSKEEISFVFKFRTLNFSVSSMGNECTSNATKVEASFCKSKDVLVTFQVKSSVGDHFEDVSGLQLRVNTTHPVIDRTFSFYQGYNEIFSKNVLIDQNSPWRGTFHDSNLHAMSENEKINIIATTRGTKFPNLHEIRLKARLNSQFQMHSFHLFVYGDRYLANLLCIFKFRVQIVPRYAIKGRLGQVEQEPKILPLSTFPSGFYSVDDMKFFSSKPDTLRGAIVTSKEEHISQQGNAQSNRWKLCIEFKPNKEGPCQAIFKVVCAQANERPKGLYTCILTAVACKPHISQRYKITLVAGKISNKKISYSNPYDHERRFRMRGNFPDILKFHGKQFSEVRIPPKSKRYFSFQIDLSTQVQDTVREVLLFVTSLDEHARLEMNEECLCVELRCLPPPHAHSQ